MLSRKAVGQTGEQLARDFLTNKGLKVVETNFRMRLGEIDIICRDGPTVVFVEVKTRTSDSFGLPCEAVGPQKQRRLRRLAQAYLAGHRLESSPVRFDVLSIRLDAGPPVIEHLIEAF